MDDERLMRVPCVRAFLALEDDLDRFDFAAELALRAPEVPARDCTEKTRIPGCDSGLYYTLECRDGRLLLTTQSDALFVKGLGAMLGEVLAAYPPRTFAEEPAGLARMLYDRGLIAPQRHQGLSELEERVLAFAKTCQKTQSLCSI